MEWKCLRPPCTTVNEAYEWSQPCTDAFTLRRHVEIEFTQLGPGVLHSVGNIEILFEMDMISLRCHRRCCARG